MNRTYGLLAKKTGLGNLPIFWTSEDIWGAPCPPQDGADRDARSPQQATRDGLSASFAAAKNITAEKLGDTARTFTAQTESGNYRGEIIGETELHVVQRLSPQSAVAHMKDLLDSAPKIGENVGIGYVNQVGSVKELRDRSRVRELAR